MKTRQSIARTDRAKVAEIINSKAAAALTNRGRRVAWWSAVLIFLVAAVIAAASAVFINSKEKRVAGKPFATSASSESSIAGPPESPPLSEADRDRNLIAQAKDCTEAYNKQDWGKLADVTYEPVVKKVGGRSAMVKLMTREAAEGRPGGFSLGEASIGDIKQVVTSRGKIFATVEEDLTLGTPSGDCYVAAWLLCISADRGREWKFVSIAGDTDRMRRMIPEIPAELDLLKQSKPQPIRPRSGVPEAK